MTVLPSMLMLVLAAEPPEWPDPGSEVNERAILYAPVEPKLMAPDETLEITVEQDLLGEKLTKNVWYGWRLMIGDGVATLLSIVGGFSNSTELVIAAGGVYLFAGAAGHLTRLNFWRGVLSIVVRAAFPAISTGAFALTMCGANPNGCGDSLQLGMIFGGFIGVLAGAAFDDGYLAMDEVLAEEIR